MTKYNWYSFKKIHNFLEYYLFIEGMGLFSKWSVYSYPVIRKDVPEQGYSTFKEGNLSDSPCATL